METVTKSTDEGFTGTPDKWFDDKEFYYIIPGYEDLYKKDSYFQAYSPHYIHEIMLKDSVSININVLDKN